MLFGFVRKFLYICKKKYLFKLFISMKRELITETEMKRISQLTEEKMLKESQSWQPSQWAAYLTKGITFGDTELDRFIEDEIIEK